MGYEIVDRLNNVWKCRKCGNLEQFEADGPWENGWKMCPVCGEPIPEPEDEEPDYSRMYGGIPNRSGLLEE